MAFTLDDLNAETTAGDDDLLHFRNTSGLDKKIKYSDLSTQVLSYVDHIKKATHTETGTAGWRTLLRTQKNFQGLVKISAYAGDRRQFLTLDVYGDEDTGEWDVGFVSQSQKGASTTPGIYRLRWGDAGNGNGFCLQPVNKGSDPSVLIKVVTFAALPVDSSLTAGFTLGPFTDTQSDLDSNTVSAFYGDYYSFMFNSLVAINHRRYQDLEDKVISSGTLMPGVYKSLSITGSITMSQGKYLVLGDCSISGGATVTVPTSPRAANGTTHPGYDGYPEALFTALTIYNDLSGCNGRFGGGNGGRAESSGGAGGPGPGSAGSRSASGGTAGLGGGFIFLNVLGTFTNSGTILADGSAGGGSPVGGGGGGGGHVGLRCFQTGNTYGTIRARGGAGTSGLSNDGAGGGGGIIEIYAPETPSGTFTVTGGGANYPGSSGATWRINALTSGQEKYWDAGGSDIVTANEYLYAGKCTKMQGGWVP